MKTYHQKTILRTSGKQKQKLRIALRYSAAAGIAGMVVFAVMFATGNLGTPKIAQAAVVTYTTRANGNWTNTSGVWSINGGQNSCSCAPSASVSASSIVINHTINMNTNVTVSGTGNISISKTGSLTTVLYDLEIQSGWIASYGTISVDELRILSSGTGSFYGPVTGISRLRFEGTTAFDALTTVTAGDLELRSGSVNKVGDKWQASLTNGDIVNESTLNFDGNIFTILNGDFVNSSSGVVTGFGNIETKTGSITNNGTWDTDVDWCASGISLTGLPDPENCLEPVVSSPSCDNEYVLDLDDTSTFSVTCGDINAGNWNVKGMTCWFSTPVFSVGGSVGGPNRIADWSVEVNQTGNLENNDTASAYYYVNGLLVRTDAYPGGAQPSVFTSARRILVPSGGNYQVKIRLMNDKANELWQVKTKSARCCLLSITPPVSPLPVTLIDFKGKEQNKKVVLTWATAGELNNDYFTLERSPNGYVFSEFASVEGAGTSSVIHKYSFTDSQPFYGTTYYRLVQTDFDGKSTIYKIISVSITSKPVEGAALKISPNPFTQTFTAEFELDEAKPVTIQLINVTGAIAFTENIMGEQGSNHYRFTTPYSLKPVAYNLRITNNNNVIASTKVICRK